jgi:hypothetical protein
VEAAPAILWSFLRGALMTRAIAIAADLGIAVALADGPKHVGRLAEEAGADPDTLQRVLSALAADGVFRETEPGVFDNTEVSNLLRDTSQSALAHLFGGAYFRAIAELDASGGQQPFSRAFGTDFWSWLSEHPAERDAFDQAMSNGVQLRVEQLASLDWRGDEVVVDLGGGNGALLVELLRDRPGMRGILFDLSSTVRDDRLPDDRIELVVGSFFEEVPAGDAYVLSAVIHDWDDEAAGAILRTIRSCAPPHARLVVIDGVLGPESGSEWRWADLHLLAVLGGRERDATEWRRLLAAGGFEPVSIRNGLIEARPISPTT